MKLLHVNMSALFFSLLFTLWHIIFFFDKCKKANCNSNISQKSLTVYHNVNTYLIYLRRCGMRANEATLDPSHYL